MPINPLNLFEKQSCIAKKSLCVEEGLSLHYRQDLPGELQASAGFTHHIITFFITDNKRQVTHLDHYGKYDGKMSQGEFYLYPAEVSGFTSWEAKDETLHLIIKPDLLRKVASATGCLNSERIELLPVLKKYDAQIDRLSQLFLQEIYHDSFGSQLYLESLSNVLSIHLLRNYSVFKPLFREQTNGLAPHKLHQTIDYIQDRLDRDLSLESMAQNIGMSRYYFATRFKQATGISPHKYVTQQRIERAKQLLKKTQKHRQYSKLSLAQIALDCGFSSQSHFNKVFRQYVGVTPKKYQENL